MRRSPEIPEGHGEVVTRPEPETWGALARANALAAASWTFTVGGREVDSLRREARSESISTARDYTASLGLPAPCGDEPELVVVTGHQPELFHTGVWAKYFMLQCLTNETGALGVDLVVDTDVTRSLGLMVPHLGSRAARQHCDLWTGAEMPFVSVPVPGPDGMSAFCDAGHRALSTLPAPAVQRHFTRFCTALQESAHVTDDIASLVTATRRRFEGHLTDYLELSVARLARSVAYLTFAADILLDAARFAECFNTELDAYREARKVRSRAQPFPDLEVAPHGVEVPFWLIADGDRHRAFVHTSSNGTELIGGNVRIGIPGDHRGVATALSSAGCVLAPRALTLTLYARLLLADLFIHGIGGGRYDRVTDGVAMRYWGVKLPPFAVGSLTMYLPLGAHAVDPTQIEALDRAIQRLEHNPDEFVADVEFDDEGSRELATGLAAEKRLLVAEISRDGADKQALGARIRTVNERLTELLEPVGEDLVARRAQLVAQAADAEVLTDRTYPFCLWSPEEIADKVG